MAEYDLLNRYLLIASFDGDAMTIFHTPCLGHTLLHKLSWALLLVVEDVLSSAVIYKQHVLLVRPLVWCLPMCCMCLLRAAHQRNSQHAVRRGLVLVRTERRVATAITFSKSV